MLSLLLMTALAADSFHVMKQVTVMDQHGFEKPMVAATMLIPKDWSFESNIVYAKPGGCSGMLISTFKAASPDGKTALEGLPAYGWQWGDDPQYRQMISSQAQQSARSGMGACDILQPMNAAAFLKYAIPRIRNGAQADKVEPIPGVREVIQQQAKQLQAQANQIGLNARYAADDGRAHVTYDFKGSKVEEWITAVVNMSQMVIPSMAPTYTFSASLTFGMRAPEGQLLANENLYKLMIGSIRINPEWQGRVMQVQQNINDINANGNADRARIRAQAADDQRKIITEGYESRQRSQDRSNAQFSQYIRDVETYKDPSSGASVELPSMYGHAWSNGNGEYIVSDQAGFNPNEHVKGNWSQLQRAR